MDGIPSVSDVLDAREVALVRRVLNALDAREDATGDAGARHVRAGLDRLVGLWQSIDDFPPTRGCQRLGARTRNLETLLDRFSNIDSYSVEAYLPTRAALARAYSMAKFNFSRLLGYVVADCVTLEDPLASTGSTSILDDIETVQRAAVAAIIGEDVLRSLASDSTQARELRRRATRVLTELWDARATQSLADFAPLIGSAWRAKAMVHISYGTLAGVTELFQLLRNGCDPAFVDYFSSEEAPSEQYAAFEEFLFNATYEELSRMRAYMQEHGRHALDAKAVARIFNVQLDRLHTTTGTPQDMFFTFRERENWAAHRRLRRLEGPKRTAEEYVMVFVLGRQPAENEDGLGDCVEV